MMRFSLIHPTLTGYEINLNISMHLDKNTSVGNCRAYSTSEPIIIEV